MSSSLTTFNLWLLRKIVMVALATAAGFATYGSWLFLHDDIGYPCDQATLSVHYDHLQGEVSRLEQQAIALDEDIATQTRRLALAVQVIATLKSLESTWDRLIWHSEQQRSNDEQAARMKAMKRSAKAELSRLKPERVACAKAYDKASRAFARIERTLRDQALGYSAARHYFNETWQLGRWYVGFVVAVYLLGPTFLSLGFYYGLAPFVARRRPMRLAEAQAAVSTASTGIAVVENAVWPGETLVVKKKFIESGDADLERKTRALLSWRFPFASLAGGLFNLAVVRNVRNAGARRIIMGGSARTAVEFTVVEVPEGGSLVVRPAFLAGAMSPAGERLVIRSHWRFFCWQSWVAGQFRFFEFIGPCRLILAKRGGLRVERLVERAETRVPAARVRQLAVVAFTPDLECRPVRAVSFWRYYVGKTKLFEAGFGGPGLVVHTASATSAGTDSGGLRLRTLKILGL